MERISWRVSSWCVIEILSFNVAINLKFNLKILIRHKEKHFCCIIDKGGVLSKALEHCKSSAEVRRVLIRAPSVSWGAQPIRQIFVRDVKDVEDEEGVACDKPAEVWQSVVNWQEGVT